MWRKNMRGSTHAAIGLLGAAALALEYNITQPAPLGLILAGGVLGALLPDIDHPNSRISHKAGIAGAPFRLFGHRGFTHSLLALALVWLGLAAIQIPLVYGLAFIIGYASHMISDAMTPSGIVLLWPLKGRWRLIPRDLAVPTGGIVDKAIAAVSAVSGLALAWSLILK
jgi:inner membrane protein